MGWAFSLTPRSQIDYTGVDISSPCHSCARNFTWNSTVPCHCTVSFRLEQPFEVGSINNGWISKYPLRSILIPG